MMEAFFCMIAAPGSMLRDRRELAPRTHPNCPARKQLLSPDTKNPQKKCACQPRNYSEMMRKKALILDLRNHVGGREEIPESFAGSFFGQDKKIADFKGRNEQAVGSRQWAVGGRQFESVPTLHFPPPTAYCLLTTTQPGQAGAKQAYGTIRTACNNADRIAGLTGFIKRFWLRDLESCVSCHPVGTVLCHKKHQLDT
jgi:hypothetical protein